MFNYCLSPWIHNTSINPKFSHDAEKINQTIELWTHALSIGAVTAVKLYKPLNRMFYILHYLACNIEAEVKVNLRWQVQLEQLRRNYDLLVL